MPNLDSRPPALLRGYVPLFAVATAFALALVSGRGAIAWAGDSASAHVADAGSDRGTFQYAVIERGPMTCAVRDEAIWQKVKDLQSEVKRTGHEVYWFAINGRQYVVRDTSSVRKAEQIVEPMNRLGAEQGRLGGLQGELGAKQGEIGAMQGRLSDIQDRLASLDRAADPELRHRIDELERQVDELAAQLRERSAEQRELSAQQRELGERQREVGEEQRRVSATAWSQLQSLAQSTIDSGKAEPLSGD